MTCPKCGGDRFIVFDSHKTDSDVIRIRKCKDCAYKAYTIEEEAIDDASLEYAKRIIRDQSRDYQKLAYLRRRSEKSGVS